MVVFDEMMQLLTTFVMMSTGYLSVQVGQNLPIGEIEGTLILRLSLKKHTIFHCLRSSSAPWFHAGSRPLLTTSNSWRGRDPGTTCVTLHCGTV